MILFSKQGLSPQKEFKKAGNTCNFFNWLKMVLMESLGCTDSFPHLFKGRTIRKVMGGGGGEFSVRRKKFFRSLLVHEFFFFVQSPLHEFFFLGGQALFSILLHYV